MKRVALLLVSGIILLSCGDGADAPRSVLPLGISPSEVSDIPTNQGYTVTLTAYRLAVADIHLQDSTRVLGAAVGPYVIDWVGDENKIVGAATLHQGRYNRLTLLLRTATDDPEVRDTDPLQGHTAFIEGSAKKDGKTTLFSMAIDSPYKGAIWNIPFDADIGPDTSGVIALSVRTVASSGETLFDDLDFERMDADGNGKVIINIDRPEYAKIFETIIDSTHYNTALERLIQ